MPLIPFLAVAGILYFGYNEYHKRQLAAYEAQKAKMMQDLSAVGSPVNPADFGK